MQSPDTIKQLDDSFTPDQQIEHSANQSFRRRIEVDNNRKDKRWLLGKVATLAAVGVAALGVNELVKPSEDRAAEQAQIERQANQPVIDNIEQTKTDNLTHDIMTGEAPNVAPENTPAVPEGEYADLAASVEANIAENAANEIHNANTP